MDTQPAEPASEAAEQTHPFEVTLTAPRGDGDAALAPRKLPDGLPRMVVRQDGLILRR
jgi:hypothetical protein